MGDFDQQDRVKQISSTTGTGAYVFDSTPAGYRSFATAVGNFKRVTYVATMGSDYEVGYGLTNGGTLMRAYVLASSNANAAVNWAAGNKEVVLAPIALATPYGRNTTGESSAPASESMQLGYVAGSTWGMNDGRVYMCYDGPNGSWNCIANWAFSVGGWTGSTAVSGIHGARIAAPYVGGNGGASTVISATDTEVTVNANFVVLCAIFGAAVAASGSDYSFGHGAEPILNYKFQRAHGFSRPTGTTIAQKNEVGLALRTTDATPTPLRIEAGVSTARLTVATGRVMTFRAMVQATNGTLFKSWIVTGAIRNFGGTTALTGTPTVTEVGAEGTGIAGVTLAVSADDTNDALVFTATGLAATTLRWLGAVDLLVSN